MLLADNSGYVDIGEWSAFFDFYGGEGSTEAMAMLETLEAEAAAYKALHANDDKQQREQSKTQVVRTEASSANSMSTGGGGGGGGGGGDGDNSGKPRESGWTKRARKMYEWLNEQIGRANGSRISCVLPGAHRPATCCARTMMTTAMLMVM